MRSGRVGLSEERGRGEESRVKQRGREEGRDREEVHRKL